MRNGYWKTLLSRLRGRVAQSNRVLHLGNVTFVLQEICASDDAPLDEGVDILLALDSHGNALLVDPANTEIRLRLVHAVEIIAPGFTSAAARRTPSVHIANTSSCLSVMGPTAIMRAICAVYPR